MNETPVSLSSLDEERFGIRTVRVNVLTGARLLEVMDFCEREQVKLLVARCSASDLPLVHRMEESGFLLMDTLVYYRRNLVNVPAMDDPPGLTVRPVSPGEELAVQKVAKEAFTGYQSHYHADPRLDPARCDEAYSSWAVRSCTVPGVVDHVLVATSERGLLGFATLRMTTPEEGEGVLFAVSPVAQGKGIHRLLVIRGLEWCQRRAAKCMVYSTQVTNLAVQKALVRLGFEPSGSFYTFHKWFS